MVIFGYIPLVLLLGLVTTSLLFPGARLRVSELLGLCILAGVGTLGLLLFWLSLMSITPDRAWIPAGIIALIVALLLRQKSKLARPLPLSPLHANGRTLWLIIPLVAIAFCIVAMAWNALAFPLYEWDAFSIWFLKAKILLHEPLLPKPAYFHDPAMSFTHRDYPLMQPLFVAGAWGIRGLADDRLGRLVLILPYIGMALLFFAEARRRTSLVAAAWLTAVFVCAPALPFWAPTGDADVMVAAFFCGVLIYLARWLEARDRRHIFTAGFFACCMWFTKHEGEALALIVLAVIFTFVPIIERRFRRDVWIYPVMLLLLLLPWHLWSWDLPHSNRRYPDHLGLSLVIENLEAIAAGVKMVASEFVRWHSWGLLFPLLAICAALSFRRVRETSASVIWLIFLGQLGFLVMAYALALPSMKLEMSAGMRRLFVQVTPVVAMLLLMHWPTAPAKRGQSE